MNAINLMVGKTLEKVTDDGDEMLFVCTDGSAFRAYHMQNCCEHVRIHDVKGEFSSLCGKPLTLASVAESGEWPGDVPNDGFRKSFTWTTFIFQAGDETVVVRWLGESNGYYSESVYFDITHKPIEVTVNGETWDVTDDNQHIIADLLEEHGRIPESQVLRGKVP